MLDAAKNDPVFLDAIERVLGDEGGYVNLPDDPGGETNFGISKRSYPEIDVAHLTRDRAIEIYYRDWWERFGFPNLRAEAAIKVFDLSIVMGAKAAIRCLQRAMRACGAQLEEDGVIGAATIYAVNSYLNVQALLAAIRSEAAAYFRATAARQGREDEFLQGWLVRAYS